MRKSMKLTMTLLALCVVAALASCSKNKRGDILKYVPADATGMVYFNGEQIVGQAGVRDGKVGAAQGRPRELWRGSF